MSPVACPVTSSTSSRSRLSGLAASPNSPTNVSDTRGGGLNHGLTCSPAVLFAVPPTGVGVRSAEASLLRPTPTIPPHLPAKGSWQREGRS